MIKTRKTQNRRAQSMIEYVTVIGIVTAVLMAMNPFIKRTIQGGIKTAADQIGTQEDAEQNFNESFINMQHVNSQTTSETSTHEFDRNIEYEYKDKTLTYEDSYTNLQGIAEEDSNQE